MDEVIKGVRRDQRVLAQMKGDVTREATWRVMGPWWPVEPGLERKPSIGGPDGPSLRQCGEGTLCNKISALKGRMGEV